MTSLLVVDECLERVAKKFGVPYHRVYEAVYGEEDFHFGRGSSVECSFLSLKKCDVTRECISFEEECVSRTIPDADLINKDPDAYVLKSNGGKPMTTEALEKLVKLASYLYHTSSGGGLTDNSYDALEYHLRKRLKLKNRAYEKVGAEPVKRIRSRLPISVPSLEKVYPDGVGKWLAGYPKGDKSPPSRLITYTLKLDGISGLCMYTQPGPPTRVFTRGDGEIGGDITEMCSSDGSRGLKVASIVDDSLIRRYGGYPVYIRGEFVLEKRIFEEKYLSAKQRGGSPSSKDDLSASGRGGGYAFPRSFVSAKINAGYISQGLQDIDFVAYHLYVSQEDGTVVSPLKKSKMLRVLSRSGFSVPEYETLEDPTTFEITEKYISHRSTSKYPIDGLVLTYDTLSPMTSSGGAGSGTSASDYTSSIAFKVALESQERWTTVIDVDWAISRYGRFVPVAVYEAVYIDGSRMKRATAHNAAHIRDWSMGRGTKIKIRRSGDVIPQIKDVVVDESVPPIYPIPPTDEDGNPVPTVWQRNDIYLVDIEGNLTVQIKRASHFFETLEIPRLREKTLEKIFEAGWRSIPEIVGMSVKDFETVKGIGKKTAEAFYKSIHSKLSSTRIDRFLPALTGATTGVGRETLITILKKYPRILVDSSSRIKKTLSSAAYKIPGIGPKRIDDLAKGIPALLERLREISPDDISTAIERDLERLENSGNIPKNPKIEGGSFVLTGFMGKRNYNLEDYIYDNDGNLSSSVTSSTRAVVCANPTEVTSKMREAAEKGIKVYTLQEFEEWCGVKFKGGFIGEDV